MRATSDPIERHVAELRLKGTATGLRAGDAVLIVGDERVANSGDEHWDFRVLERVETVPDKGYTRIAFSLGLGDQHPTEMGPAQQNPRIFALRLRAALFGHNAPEWDSLDPAIKLRAAPSAIEVITGVAFSPDGKRAVCSTVDGTLRLWDLVAAYPRLSLVGHVGSVNCVAYSPDGRYAVSGGDDGTVRVWDAATGEELRLFTGHRGPVLSVACGSYERQYEQPKVVGEKIESEVKTSVKVVAISAGADSGICVWDLSDLPPDTSPLIKTLLHHKGAVNSLALYLSGTIPIGGSSASLTQRLVSGADDGDVLLWEGSLFADVKAGEPQQLGKHVGAVEAVAIGAGGTRVASGGADGDVWTWVSSGTGWKAVTKASIDGHESITALVFSSNGKQLLAGGAGGDVVLWEETGKVIAKGRAHAGPVTALAWSSAQPPRVLTGGADRVLRLCNSALTLQKTLASRKPEDVSEWPDFGLEVNHTDPTIDLDSLYTSIVPGSWIVLARTGYSEAYRVTESGVRWATGFSLSSKVTRLSIDGAEHLTWFGRRNTTVYAQSEALELHVDTQPYRSPRHGRAIELAGLVPGLEATRRIVVSGQRMRARIDDASGLTFVSVDGYPLADNVALGDVLTCLSAPYPDRLDYALAQWRAVGDGFVPVVSRVGDDSTPGPKTLTLRWHLRDRKGIEGYLTTSLRPEAGGSFVEQRISALRPKDKDENKVSEVAVIERVIEVERARHRLLFTADLENLFDYETLSINANVARATHGETVAHEVLGSGDGAASNQRFSLRKKPLTYVSAPTASGGESTLDVYVNDVLWNEVPSLHDLDSRSQSYLLRRDNEQNTSVVFGDGVHGARLPTGQENIVAGYRTGLGPEGEVAAETVKLLQTKPLGIREAINPVAATGAAPPESLVDARAHAPLTVLTLDRIVSLKDYEDFAAGFAGVGKAQATALWTGSSQLVHITVATATGGPLDVGSALYQNLLAALASLRDQAVPVRVQGFGLLHFKLTAALRVDQRYRPDQVKQQVLDALNSAFSFEQREFAQPVTRAEVTTIIQAVAGVVAVNLTAFARTDAGSGEVRELLTADRATWNAGLVRPAQLLLLYPTVEGVTFEDMEP